uniref:EB domain-containing protein n=1 Tax=Biomphalaria glabrata TaxID=6526 RepID=A0A2C9LVP8_BIOGL
MPCKLAALTTLSVCTLLTVLSLNQIQVCSAVTLGKPCNDIADCVSGSNYTCAQNVCACADGFSNHSEICRSKYYIFQNTIYTEIYFFFPRSDGGGGCGRDDGFWPVSFQRTLAFTNMHHKPFSWRPSSPRTMTSVDLLLGVSIASDFLQGRVASPMPDPTPFSARTVLWRSYNNDVYGYKFTVLSTTYALFFFFRSI